jgi:hypothetical protein
MSLRLSQKRQLANLGISQEDIPELSIAKRRTTRSETRPLRGEELEIIPQIGDTCWFNSILTIILYSELIRKVLLEEANKWFKNKEELKKNKFKRFLIYMLNYNYTEPKKIAELFEKRVKPEFLLYSFMEYYKVLKIKSNIKQNLSASVDDWSYYISFFTTVLKKIFTNPLDIIELIFFENNTYLRKKGLLLSSFLANPPKIIILYNDKIFKKNLLPIKQSTIDDFYKINEMVNNEQISNYENKITVNDYTYNLDASFIINYHKPTSQQVNHVISGITYNSNGFIYNGELGDFNERIGQTSLYIQKRKKSQCPLFSRDWKSDLKKPEYTAGFCLPKYYSKNCSSLGKINKNDYCFDLSIKNENKTLLIYVLEEKEAEIETRLIDSLIEINKIVYKSKSISPIIKDIYDFQGKTTEQLKKLLLDIYNKDDLLYFIEFLELYKIFYFFLTNEQLTDELLLTERNKVLKTFFAELLKVYIKDDKIFKFEALDDNNIHLNLHKKQIITLATKIGYESEEIDKLIETTIILEKYLILYYVISRNYDKKDYDTTTFEIFVYYLCKFFILNGNKIELSSFTDNLILSILKNNSIEELKAFIQLITKEEPNPILQLISFINNEEDFELLLQNQSSRSIVEAFIKSNLIFKNLEESKELSLKNLLVLIIINYLSINDLLNIIKYQSLTIKGGSYKRKKQLKIY